MITYPDFRGFKCPILTPEQVAGLTEDNPCQCPSLKCYNQCQISLMQGDYNKYFTCENSCGRITDGRPSSRDLALNFTDRPNAKFQGSEEFRKLHKLVIPDEINEAAAVA